MEPYYEDPCGPPPPAPAPVEPWEPAPLPAYEPPADVAPAPELFPEPVAAPAPPAPEPIAPAPVAEASVGFVGGTPDLSASGTIGGTPDLSASGTVSGPAALGTTWIDDHGTPVARPADIPVIPGPFNGAGDQILGAGNAATIDEWLGGAPTPAPAPWTPGYDSDHDGILNERDGRPRDPFASI